MMIGSPSDKYNQTNITETMKPGPDGNYNSAWWIDAKKRYVYGDGYFGKVGIYSTDFDATIVSLAHSQYAWSAKQLFDAYLGCFITHPSIYEPSSGIKLTLYGSFKSNTKSNIVRIEGLPANGSVALLSSKKANPQEIGSQIIFPDISSGVGYFQILSADHLGVASIEIDMPSNIPSGKTIFVQAVSLPEMIVSNAVELSIP